MIQRIQTLFLFFAFVAAILVYFFPLATFTAPDFECVLKVTGVTYILNGVGVTSVNTIPMLILISLIAGLSLASVFFYKNRILQLKLVKINLIASVVFVAIAFFLYSDRFSSKIAGMKPVFYQAGSYLSLIIVVMLLLAARRIIHDDKKIKDSDRIR